MKSAKISPFIIFSVVCIGLSGCESDPTKQQLDGFSDYLEKLGYQFHNPPRANMGPGTVFRIINGNEFSPVCRNLFAGIEPETADISIATENTSDVLQAGMSISIISDLLDAGNLSASYDSNTEISFRPVGNVKSVHYFEEDAINSAGEPREMTSQCMGRLRQISEASGLSQDVYFIFDAVQLEGVEYSAKSGVGADASANFVRKLIASVKPKVSYDSTSSSSLVFKEKRFIAFRSMKINRFVDTGLTSTGTAVIQAEPAVLPKLQ